MLTVSELYRTEPRNLTRAAFEAIRRQARRNGCAYRLRGCYVSRHGVEACDATGNLLQARATLLDGAQWSRRNGLRDAARSLLQRAAAY